jgi:hypothetical protein
MNPVLANLTASVEAIADPEDRQTGRALAILITSLEVGADVQRLSEHTGFPIEIVQKIADRMIEAGLVVLFAHAQVALGSVLRKAMPEYVLYIDRETGEEVLRREHILQ